MITRAKALPKILGQNAKTLNIADDVTSAVLRKLGFKLPKTSKLAPLVEDTVTIAKVPQFTNWNTQATGSVIQGARVVKTLPNIVFKA